MATPSTTRTHPKHAASTDPGLRPARALAGRAGLRAVPARRSLPPGLHEPSGQDAPRARSADRRRVLATGRLVADPMAGIGTTLVEAAASRTGVRSASSSRPVGSTSPPATSSTSSAPRTARSSSFASATHGARDVAGDLAGTSRPRLHLAAVRVRCRRHRQARMARGRPALSGRDTATTRPDGRTSAMPAATAYETALARVYAGCFELLRPGGVLAVVTKNTRRTRSDPRPRRAHRRARSRGRLHLSPARRRAPRRHP